MKIKYILGLLVPCLVQGAAEADLNKGIDLTGRTSVTPSILNQLVDNGTIKTNKGLIIASATAPDVDLNRRYTNFLWLDLGVTPPTLKSWAAGVIGSDFNNATNWAAATIGSLSVTTAKLADGAVTSDKLGTNSVNNSKIATNAISVTQMQVDSVGVNQIQASAVNNDKLGADAVTAAKIKDGEVGTVELADSSVTSNKIGAAQITLDKLASQLGAANLSGNIIGQTNLQANSVAQTNLQANSVVASNITAGTITYDKIVATNFTLMPIGFARLVTSSTDGTIDTVQTNGIYLVRNSAWNYTVTFPARSVGVYVAQLNGADNSNIALSQQEAGFTTSSYTFKIVGYTLGAPASVSTNHFVLYGY